MTAVIKKTRSTFVGGPGSGQKRSECWSATSVDGIWSYERAEDVGTSWYVKHIPSDTIGDQPYGTLTSARRATHSGLALRQIILECTEVVENEQWPIEVRNDARRRLALLVEKDA